MHGIERIQSQVGYGGSTSRSGAVSSAAASSSEMTSSRRRPVPHLDLAILASAVLTLGCARRQARVLDWGSGEWSFPLAPGAGAQHLAPGQSHAKSHIAWKQRRVMLADELWLSCAYGSGARPRSVTRGLRRR